MEAGGGSQNNAIALNFDGGPGPVGDPQKYAEMDTNANTSVCFSILLMGCFDFEHMSIVRYGPTTQQYNYHESSYLEPRPVCQY